MFPDLDSLDLNPPSALTAIELETIKHGFDMASVHETGALLRCLARSRQTARFLELGTGTGIATCWLLDGMDPESQLISLDTDAEVLKVARTNLGQDSRLTILCQDGAEFLQETHPQFDLIFADAWPGKFSHLNEALALLADNGIYVVDDLLPQASWPEGHGPRVPVFIDALNSRQDLDVEYREWSSGILLARKRKQSELGV